MGKHFIKLLKFKGYYRDYIENDNKLFLDVILDNNKKISMSIENDSIYISYKKITSNSPLPIMLYDIMTDTESFACKLIEKFDIEDYGKLGNDFANYVIDKIMLNEWYLDDGEYILNKNGKTKYKSKYVKDVEKMMTHIMGKEVDMSRLVESLIKITTDIDVKGKNK